MLFLPVSAPPVLPDGSFLPEICGQKFFQNIRAHSLIHQRFFFYFYIKMQIWAFFLIIFFHCDPIRNRLPGQLDHTFDTIFRNSGKACDINDPRNTVYVLKSWDLCPILLVGKTHAPIHISHTVPGKGSAC